MGGNDVPGVVGGGYSDHVLLAPPFIATHENIDAIVDALGLALDDVFGKTHRPPQTPSGLTENHCLPISVAIFSDGCLWFQRSRRSRR